MERGWGYGLETMSNRKKKPFWWKSCLNFRRVRDIIGEQGLSPAPTLVVGRNSSGSRCSSGGRPTILPLCLPGLISSGGRCQRLSGSGLLMIGDRFKSTN